MAKSKAKWAGLRGTYTSLDEDATRGEAFVEARKALEGHTLGHLTETYNTLYEQKQALNAQLSVLNLNLDALERTIDDRLAAAEMESATLHGYHWTRSPAPYPNVEDKHLLRAWCDEHMPDALSLQSGTLKAVVRAKLEAGEALPPGVTVYVKDEISRRKA